MREDAMEEEQAIAYSRPFLPLNQIGVACCEARRRPDAASEEQAHESLKPMAREGRYGFANVDP